jgi:formate dehydrogenase subunit gamma
MAIAKSHKILALLIAIALMLAMSLFYHEAPAPVVQDGTSEATLYTLEEGQTAGTKSEAQIKAESGLAGVTQSRIRDAGVFQNNQGQWWRTLRNGPVTFYGGWLLSLLPALILTFYAIVGPMKLHDAPTGRLMQRFCARDRVIHWTTAISFVVLALTGIAILFGKHVLIPLIGHGAFSWIAVIAKNVHNVVGPLFAVSVALMFAYFVRDNLFRTIDLQWFANAHLVLTGRKHIPSYKYNGAEKIWFWGGVTMLGLVVSVSGLVLDFPTFEQSRMTMQIANLVHGIGALLFIAAGLGHIYMGTIGAKGAFQAMKSGMVDETWAREHHELWYDEIKGKQR